MSRLTVRPSADYRTRIMPAWLARWLRPRRAPVPTYAHQHYCEPEDHRWNCREAYCLRHDATPCWQHWGATAPRSAR